MIDLGTIIVYVAFIIDSTEGFKSTKSFELFTAVW